MRATYDYTKLIQYINENPNKSVVEISEALGCTKQHVYNVRHRTGISKKMTNRKLTNLKVVRKKTLEAKDSRIAELETERVKLQQELDFSVKVNLPPNPPKNTFPIHLVQKINNLNATIAEKDDEIGELNGVIKYLEKNLREALARLRTKNGSTV